MLKLIMCTERMFVRFVAEQSVRKTSGEAADDGRCLISVFRDVP